MLNSVGLQNRHYKNNLFVFIDGNKYKELMISLDQILDIFKDNKFFQNYGHF